MGTGPVFGRPQSVPAIPCSKGGWSYS